MSLITSSGTDSQVWYSMWTHSTSNGVSCWRMRQPLKLTLLCAGAAAIVAAARVQLIQTEVFRSGEGGYHTYRIPALITSRKSRKGTLLAFCEGRRQSGGDSGDIDLLLKRSFDQGKTWTKTQVIADFGADTIGNPAPVVEHKTGAILLLLTRNPGSVTEKQIIESSADATRTVWITHSADAAATWAPPTELTASVKRPDST